MLLRTSIYNVIFTVYTLVLATIGLPLMLMGRKAIRFVTVAWASVSMTLHQWITGIRHEYRGFDKIPAGGAIICIKHQSTWETIAMVPKFADPCFIMKRELLWIPAVGWWLWAAGMIPVTRGRRGAAILGMQARARQEIAKGRQILIFPEGTRGTAGAPAEYKYGAALLYKDLNVPIIPVALNSGCAWPRHSWRHRKGVIVAEVLETIPAGLDHKIAFARMQEVIEAGSDRLLVEAFERGDDLPPTAEKAARELIRIRDSGAMDAPITADGQ